MMKNNTDSVKLYPWYVHFIGGWSFGSLFSWFLVVRQFFGSGRRKTALLLIFLNLLLYTAICFFGYTSKLKWDLLSVGVIIIDCGWFVSAWLTQYFVFGRAPARFVIKEWKSWIAPVCLAISFGVGLAVVYSVFPMIAHRIQMSQSPDLLTKNLILWDFFSFVPTSLLISLPVGLWWAGEREQFTTSRLLSYLFGLILFYLVLATLYSLFYFLINLGNTHHALVNWSVLPLYPQGVQKILLGPLQNNYSTFFIAPLVLGVTPRIRDFLLKSLMYFPLLSLILIGYAGYSNEFWQYNQGDMLYQMAAAEKGKRSRAHDQAERLLSRFPDYRGWPSVGLKLAEYHYLSGCKEKALKFYREVYAKAGTSPRWTREAAVAQAALDSERFGDRSARFLIDLPQVSYESYMTGNWMSLLRILRYYEQDTATQSQTLIRLKMLSTSDEEIKLSSMPTLAELDDSASLLGYEVLLLPSDLGRIKTLLKSGYPVIQPIRHSFYLLYGLDDGRSQIEAADYGSIQAAAERLQAEDLADTRLDNRNGNEDPTGTSRLSDLAAHKLPYSFWGSTRQRDMGPVIAVVVPKEKMEDLIVQAGMTIKEPIQQSNAYLTAYIALNALTSGDITGAVEWSLKSYRLRQDPLPLHIAHLAVLLWNSRETILKSSLNLERQFPRLAFVDQYFQQPAIASFLSLAAARFRDDRAAKKLSWMVRNQYMDFLDRSIFDDRKIMIALAQTNIDQEPFSTSDWITLATLQEWDENKAGIIAAYQGLLDSDDWNDTLATRLACLNVEAGQFEQAEKLLSAVSGKTFRFNPDYYYCQGAVAQYKGQTGRADRSYQQAIKMRKYAPHYHRRYAEFLKKEDGDADRINKLLYWASMLDRPGAERTDHPGNNND